MMMSLIWFQIWWGMEGNTPLPGLKNLGPTIVKRLNSIGIESREDLERVRPAEVYRRLRACYTGQTLAVCYYLYSLQGVLNDRHWDDYSDREKAKMKEVVGI